MSKKSTKQPAAAEPLAAPKPQKRERDEKFFRTMRERFKLAQEALAEIHAEALADWKFRLGDQWDSLIEGQRKNDGRPCYVINRIPQFIRQLTGEQKKARPAIQISPIGDGSDIETAEIVQGVCRHIERCSNAEEAYDTGFDHMATGGFGFIRAVTKYVDGDSFDQEIVIEREPNAFAHYPDPRSKELDYSDARYWFVIDTLSREDYVESYGESEVAGLQDWGGLADQAPGWYERDSVRVAEYFYVETEQVTLSKNGRSRTKEEKRVYWCLTNGVEILDEEEIPGEYIPIVPVLGEEILVEGRRHLISLVRYAREPQRLYNLWQSAMAETIALAPKAPFVATAKQLEGYEEVWAKANTANFPYLPVNPDPAAPGWPVRQFGEPPIQAITSAIAHADNDLKTTTGLYDPSLGAPGPEQSGKAILLRQQQGQVSTFGFQDSMKRAIKQLGRVIVGWIPYIYDTERVVRIVNPDGTSKNVPINQHFQDDDGLRKVFDLTVGRYDVAISDGPSFESARQEAAQNMLQLVQAQPELMQVIGDLLVSNFDWPTAPQIAERLKKLLPPQLQDSPAGNIPPQVAGQMQQLAAQHQALVGAVQQLTQERDAKLLEIQSKEKIAAWQTQAQLVIALSKLNSSDAQARADLEYDRLSQLVAQGHDVAMQAREHAYQDAAAQQAHAQTMQQQAAGHVQTMQQAQQGAGFQQQQAQQGFRQQQLLSRQQHNQQQQAAKQNAALAKKQPAAASKPKPKKAA
jgi:hypothetical protein